MDSEKYKALNEMMDTCINMLEKKNQSLAASSAALAADNEQQRQQLAKLKKRQNAPKPSLPRPLPLNTSSDPLLDGTCAPETLESLTQLVAERKEYYAQQTARIAEFMQQQRGDEYTLMPYREVQAAIADIKSTAAAEERETQCLREAQLAEQRALEHQLEQLQLETEALRPLLEQQRKLKLAAGRRLANLNFDIEQLKADAAAASAAEQTFKFSKFK